MSNVALHNITRQFPNVTALKDVTFDVQHGEFFVLLGPTGAGKTTVLRLVAGLDKPDVGEVRFDDVPVTALTPADRDVAYVFQQYSLYPNLSVYDNMAFPLRAPGRRLKREAIDVRVKEAARILHIEHLLTRKTARLSGGEMQRVSIGRAIVRQPRIFLMDEPLSNLDAKLREALRVELQHIQKTQNSTTLFVTHDQVEALTMADRIGVLRGGQLVQVGTPRDIYDRPATTFVAQLVGTPKINLLPAERSDGALHIKDSPVQVPVPDGTVPERVQVGVRPEDVQPATDGPLAGEVVLTEPLGVETIVHLRVGGQTLLSLLPGLSGLRVGENVRFKLAPNRLHYFGTDGVRL